MAYIDKVFYTAEFKGSQDPGPDFDRLADIASDLVYDICVIKPDDKDLVDSHFKKAVAYQVEMLLAQGGIDSVLGMSDAALSSGSESLGDYSVSGSSGGETAVQTYNGIPVSPMTIMLLKRCGLMNRWAYEEHYRRRCHNGI